MITRHENRNYGESPRIFHIGVAARDLARRRLPSREDRGYGARFFWGTCKFELEEKWGFVRKAISQRSQCLDSRCRSGRAPIRYHCKSITLSQSVTSS